MSIFNFNEANAVLDSKQRLNILDNFLKYKGRKVIVNTFIKALQEVGVIQNIYCVYEGSYFDFTERQDKIFYWLNQRDNIRILWDNKKVSLHKGKVYCEGELLEELSNQLMNVKKESMLLDIKILSLMLIKFKNLHYIKNNQQNNL